MAERVLEAILLVLVGGVSGAIGHYFGRRYERYLVTLRLLSEIYNKEKLLFQEFEERTTEAARGGLSEEDRERRRIETLAFRGRVELEFGDRKLANEVMGTIFQFEEAHRRTVGQQLAGDTGNVGESMQLCQEKMLMSIRVLEERLGLK